MVQETRSRVAEVERLTRETEVKVSVDLDGTGLTEVETGIGFFDHMLTALGRHSLINLEVCAKGDLEVDGHHTVEDTGIVLGQAFSQALGDKRGIRRFGSVALPMDEALVLVAVDVSGRGQLHWDVDVPPVMIGAFDASLAKEFFIAFATAAGVTLHVRSLAGENAHHMVEAVFKAVARAVREAVEPDPRMGNALPSTKGAL
ncbi:imidazoleglycerol-phosphate dehydratase HisB [Rubneribacter sp.]